MTSADTIQEKAKAVFSFADIISGYQRNSNHIYCITPAVAKISMVGRQYIYAKSLYLKCLCDGVNSIDDIAFGNSYETISDHIANNESLYYKAWCYDEGI
jgi:glycerol-3-phosphate responsive antiterminator